MPDRPLEIGLELDLPKLRRVQGKFARMPVMIRTVMRRELAAGIEQAYDWMIDERLSAEETTPRQIAKRTGRLIASMKRDVLETPRGFDAAIWQGGDDFIRMIGHVLHGGAVIVPRVKRFLTVPIAPEARGRPARSFRAFVLHARDGRLFLAQRTGNRLSILYRLMTRVVIPPRPFLRDTARLWLPRIIRRVTVAIRDLTRRLT